MGPRPAALLCGGSRRNLLAPNNVGGVGYLLFSHALKLSTVIRFSDVQVAAAEQGHHDHHSHDDAHIEDHHSHDEGQNGNTVGHHHEDQHHDHAEVHHGSRNADHHDHDHRDHDHHHGHADSKHDGEHRHHDHRGGPHGHGPGNHGHGHADRGKGQVHDFPHKHHSSNDAHHGLKKSGHGKGLSQHGQANRGNDSPPWRQAYAAALGMSVLSFVGVCLLAVLNVPAMGIVVEYTCLAFAATVLVADALVHLLPHALEGADHATMTAVGLSGVAGCFLVLIVPEACTWHHHTDCHGHSHDDAGKIQPYGVANLVVEMLHNFVDGITIGISWLASPSAGFAASLAVAVHELPQELGDFVVLRSAGFPVAKLLFWNFLASLTCVGGVAMVQFVGKDATVAVQHHLMAFTAGSFLTLALNMISPQIMLSIHKNHTGAAVVRAKVLCVIVGLLATYLLVKIGDLEVGHGHDHGHSHGHGVAHPYHYHNDPSNAEI
eukprot:TRINITY_DN4878_c0_g1_i2.p1 TRINITY_DN4878_c0_g1~~TRINITY_DN4878_c0_g1_i2.p1  ORF type:complete len:490 (+),score=45.70 TRINITY_DN4878_c0_g1_i2:82-1551(+)